MAIKKIALIGAGGKMGLRLAVNLRKSSYQVSHVEISPAGRTALNRLKFRTVDLDTALEDVDAVILAVPDNLIGKVAHELEPKLSHGVMLVCLDAAAPYAGDMPDRRDLVYFITHPCHPPVVGDEKTLEAQNDFFGGIHAKQHVVCCLMQGPEGAYVEGVRLARVIYGPVMRAHRCTLENMAILEPVLSETVAATCMVVIREATEEAIRLGVPRQAAVDFVLGHLKVEIGIAFEMFEGARFSDGALLAIEKAKESIFQPDWKKVFEPNAVKQSVHDITRPPNKPVEPETTLSQDNEAPRDAAPTADVTLAPESVRAEPESVAAPAVVVAKPVEPVPRFVRPRRSIAPPLRVTPRPQVAPSQKED